MRQGIETFLPRLKHRKLIRRKRRTVVVPLFPGYLFSQFDMADHFRAVTYTGGVRKIVTFGVTPATMDEEVINSIKDRLDLDGYVALHPPRFTPGQVVRIHGGPLSGLEAVFEREMTDHQRAILLLRALTYQARVVVPVEQVVNF